MYIIELEQGCWLAPWDGDPGITCLKENARTVRYYQNAVYALQIARMDRPFKNAKILEVDNA